MAFGVQTFTGETVLRLKQITVMKKQLALCLLFSASLVAGVQAQTMYKPPGSIRFERIPEIRSNVVDIVQDQQGFMWFAGGDGGGLHRYDGYQVTTFEHVPGDESSLSHHWIECLLVDQHGTLWIGTWGGGLNRYNPESETFSHYRNDPADTTSLSDNVITVMLEDREGAMWIGTSGGLNRFDPETETFIRYIHDPGDTSSISDSPVRAIYDDREGTLWIGTYKGGLNRFDRETGIFTRYLHDPQDETSLSSNDIVRVIFEDSRGTFWLGTRSSGFDGLHTMDRESGAFTRLRSDPNEPSMPYLRHGPELQAGVWQHVSFIYEDGSGKLWIGGYGGGLDVYDPLAEKLTHYESNSDDPNSLPDNFIWAIYESKDGTIWVGMFGGVFKAIPTLSGFTFYHPDPSDPVGLEHDNIRGLSEDSDGFLWLGAYGGGLYRLDPRSDSFISYRHIDSNNSSLSTDNVSSVTGDSSGNIWVGTAYEGIDRFNPTTQLFTNYQSIPVALHTISSIVTKPFVDSHEMLWVATNVEGLFKAIDPENGLFECYKHDSEDSTSLSNDQVSKVYEDRDGTLWVGTQSGLNRYDPVTETFIHYLSGIYILDLYEDEAGRFWVGTSGGRLYCLDRASGDHSQYTIEDGLPSGRIMGITDDDDGNLWISTSKGSEPVHIHGQITRFEPDTGRFTSYSVKDGLPDIGFYVNTTLRRRDGTLMFGGSGGLLSFKPEEFGISGEQMPPAMVLTDIRLFNDRLLPGDESPLRDPIYRADEIVLRYQQNDFTIDYAGLFYLDPEDLRYRYLLENHDGEWVDARTTRNARYSGLAPGDYVFRVRAVSGNGVWSEEDATIAITILSPWWRTGWAYALWALLLFGAVVGAYRIQHARIIRKEREQALIREAELRAEAAELQAKASETQARALKAENDRNRIEAEKARELEKAYNKLKTTQAQLIHSEKMASLGQLTAGIAHEIKNPLNFVNNFGELNVELAEELQEEMEARPETRLTEKADILDDMKVNAEQIVLHGKRADGIVNAMMQHARGNNSERESTDINVLLDQYVDLAYHGMRAQHFGFNVTIERAYDETAGSVELLAQEMGRVFLNVINNAFYAVLKRERKEGESYMPTVKMCTNRTDEGVEISVTDNGPGIPSDVKEKIFEPFFTTKPTGEGTGLGLSLAYGIVVQGHGGSMTVESVEGRGTTFIITLPT